MLKQKTSYWRVVWESQAKILIFIKAPDQIYRTLNPAISISRWCIFCFLFANGNGCRFNGIIRHNGVWDLLNGKPGRVHRKRQKHHPLFCLTFFLAQTKDEAKERRIQHKTDMENFFPSSSSLSFTSNVC